MSLHHKSEMIVTTFSSRTQVQAKRIFVLYSQFGDNT